jgi:hypothetical protein
MNPIPNQTIFGVPLQPIFGGGGNPWGAPGYNPAATAGVTDSPNVNALSDADRAGLEAQALNGFLQQATAHAIRKLFTYLEGNSPAFPQLNPQLPVLTLAVEAYRAGNFPQAFTQAFQVHRAIVLIQAQNRELPTLEAL